MSSSIWVIWHLIILVHQYGSFSVIFNNYCISQTSLKTYITSHKEHVIQTFKWINLCYKIADSTLQCTVSHLFFLLNTSLHKQRVCDTHLMSETRRGGVGL